jgi:peptidoglycan/xylan/chitin deacetylase (PgdA/CDA1 family)
VIVFRHSALLVVALLSSGCGISLIPATQVTSVEPHLTPGVVTLTFDDGRISNVAAAKLLAKHGLRGTFFINSGGVGTPGYLSQEELRGIAAGNNEIGGHTLTHPDLSTMAYDDVKRQVCDDRSMLLSWGYPVRSFAYPFGFVNDDIRQIVMDCGYNSARSLGEIKTVHPPVGTGYNCPDCATSEIIPPVNAMETKAPAQTMADWSVDDLEKQVESGAGGWVQLTFHGVCPTDCSDITISEEHLDQFLAWLARQQADGKLIVRPVGDVIGGPVRSPVAGPPLPPPPAEELTPPAEEVPPPAEEPTPVDGMQVDGSGG